ncbi:hypothetical protein SEEH1565_07595, partial [Salmonella enterica subsp. enterica serovar Heidelberg str. 41565]
KSGNTLAQAKPLKLAVAAFRFCFMDTATIQIMCFTGAMLAHFQQLAIRHWLVGLANCSPAQPVEWTVWMNHLKPVATAAQRGPTGLRAGSSPPGRQTLKNLDPWRS